MKKIFTLLLVCMSMLSAMAKDYACGLAVTVMGKPIKYQQINISVDNKDNGKYDLLLKDFTLVMEDSEMALGDIELKDVEAVFDEEEGSTHLHTTQTIALLGGAMQCPTTLEGMIMGDELAILLNIEGGLGVNVAILSHNTQIAGADFENWHTEAASSKTGNEPNGWHSFMSCAGSLAGIVTAEKVFISDDVPAQSTGKHSARVVSSSVLGSISANGTITTGRMQAGGFTAADPKNCAFLDMSKTDVDGNGDPFWSRMTGRPSSITLWYKFKAGEGNENPTASVSAVITDGTYYQDPQDKDDYDNIVAAAKNVLPETEGEWKKVTIPFDYATYAENDADAASILVTISTCSVPGGGSKSSANPDEILIDDITLNYDFVPTGIEIFEKEIVGFSADKTDYEISLDKIPTSEDIEIYCENDANAAALPYYDAEEKTLILNVYNEELTQVKTYKFKNINTGISNIDNNANKTVVGKYDLNGMRTNGKSNQVVITKYSDGTTVKSIQK